MEALFVDQPVRTIKRYARCPVDNGKLVAQFSVLMSNPPQYPHDCETCGATVNLDSAYPTILFVED